MFRFCIIISIIALLIGPAYEVTITFQVTLASPNLEVQCSHKMDKNEKFDSCKLKKDGNTFIKYTPDSVDDPEFTAVDGISEVDKKGGGKVTIKNYQNNTFGTFECGVGYKINKMDKYASKKLKLNFKKSTGCTLTWKKSSIQEHEPQGVYVAGSAAGMNLIFCRYYYEAGKLTTPGKYLAGKGCVITWTGKSYINDTYEVLMGSDYQYADMENQGAVPDGAYTAHGGDHKLYLGRGSDKDDSGKQRIGKVDHDVMYYYDDNNGEGVPTKPFSVLLCPKS